MILRRASCPRGIHAGAAHLLPAAPKRARAWPFTVAAGAGGGTGATWRTAGVVSATSRTQRVHLATRASSLATDSCRC